MNKKEIYVLQKAIRVFMDKEQKAIDKGRGEASKIWSEDIKILIRLHDKGVWE